MGGKKLVIRGQEKDKYIIDVTHVNNKIKEE